jgi:hypothetical protein
MDEWLGQEQMLASTDNDKGFKKRLAERHKVNTQLRPLLLGYHSCRSNKRQRNAVAWLLWPCLAAQWLGGRGLRACCTARR